MPQNKKPSRQAHREELMQEQDQQEQGKEDAIREYRFFAAERRADDIVRINSGEAADYAPR